MALASQFTRSSTDFSEHSTNLGVEEIWLVYLWRVPFDWMNFMCPRFTTSLALVLAVPLALTGGAALAGPLAPQSSAGATNNWTGFYAGIEYSPGAHLDEFQSPLGFLADFDGELSGFFGGIRHDFGDIVVGLEVASSSGSLPRDTVAPGVFVTTGGPEATVNRFGVEAGYDFGRILAYATAGTASIHMNFRPAMPSSQGSFYGLGTDVRVLDNLIVGAQWTSYDFDQFSAPAVSYELETLSLGIAFTF